MGAEVEDEEVGAARRRPARWVRATRLAVLRLARSFGATAFSSLTRRIVLLNLFGLATLVAAVAMSGRAEQEQLLRKQVPALQDCATQLAPLLA